ncbi:hypothetical protein Ahy_B04g071989 [Arachis hypogaea]|uniref:Uncharacterized protein n=1 Tax=Arachis hypogaea TaxID=3818 RepID=A0A444ZM67_ARAHY|nr:hypothetical protein Ahy_B04g071989 [Arachis hypogaea]
MAVALSYVQDKPTLSKEESREREEEDDRWAVGLKKPMLRLMAVVAFNWVALFRFFWYISDWMGSEVYGEEHGKLYSVAIPLYTIGYWYGARCITLTWTITELDYSGNTKPAMKRLPLNLAIEVSKIIVAKLSLSLKNVFRGENLPAFLIGAVAAAVSG